MTDKEIKKIAREYVNLNLPKGLKDNALVRNIAYVNEEMFADFLKWLLKDFAIAEKERIRAIYAEAQEWLAEKPDEYNSTLKVVAVALQDRLEQIFGKDMFEEEGE